MTTNEWPIDFETLTKDMNIGCEAIEKAYAISVRDEQYWIAHQRFIADIRTNRQDLSPNVRSFKSTGVRIMTDIEAAEWQRKQAKQRIRQFGTAGKRHAAVDKTTFSKVEQAEAEAFDQAVGATIHGINAEQRKLQRAMRALHSKQEPATLPTE